MIYLSLVLSEGSSRISVGGAYGHQSGQKSRVPILKLHLQDTEHYRNTNCLMELMYMAP